MRALSDQEWGYYLSDMGVLWSSVKVLSGQVWGELWSCMKVLSGQA